MPVSRIMGTLVIALVVILTASITEAKEVRIFPFSFELPDAWYVEGGDGGDKLFASASTKPYHPPLILVETCVSTKDKDCNKEARYPFPYDPSTQSDAYKKEFKSLGCTGSVVTVIPRENGVLEKRLVCSTVGYSLFITKNAVLWVAYAPIEKDTGIVEFLDAIANSIKVR